MVKPSVTGTTHTLPFDKLSPLDFERLCLWLVEREGYVRAEHLGAAGSEQGRDVIAYKPTLDGEELWYFQCKRYRSIGAATLKGEVDKYLQLAQEKPHLKPVGVVFVISCFVSAQIRETVGNYCEQHRLAYEFWAETELDESVKRHPDVMREFFKIDEPGALQRLLRLDSDEQRAERNRRTMLQLVRNTWVEGVLEQSLHGAAMMALGLEERGEAVEHPWEMVLRASGEPNQPLPPSTQIADVFDRMDQALLILGAPGSGKTTMLLELARHAIARAEQDPTQPIPVVFNLSSWAEKRQAIPEWLVEELNAKYHVRKTTARDWVAHDELLLLLDGLDEVQEEQREACVQAINAFRRECGVPVAICSRVADYEALAGRLDLRGAVLLQPLTPKQVDANLDRAGDELAAVREVWRTDPVFRELVQSPLMLSVATLAYRKTPVEALRQGGTIKARRKHLLDTYMERMFARPRQSEPLCTQKQAIHWLAWLAWQTTAHAQTVFLIEGLQPDWLPVRPQQRVHRVARLVAGLAAGLVMGSCAGLVAGLAAGLVMGSCAGLFVGFIFGLLSRSGSMEAVETLRWSWREGLKGLVAGLAAGLSVGLVFGLGWRLFVGLGWGLVVGLGWGLVGAGPIETVETLRWSWREGLKGLFIGLGFGLVTGLVLGPVFGLVLGPVLGLIFGLRWGLSDTELETRTVPNQGIRQSARNSLVAGLVAGLAAGLAAGLFVGLVLGPVGGLAAGLFVGPVGGLAAGLLFYGGKPVIQHLVLRYFLHREGYLPWGVVPFLDYCTERIFLRKVGGGYIFIHRLLQDYFASLYEEGAA